MPTGNPRDGNIVFKESESGSCPRETTVSPPYFFIIPCPRRELHVAPLGPRGSKGPPLGALLGALLKLSVHAPGSGLSRLPTFSSRELFKKLLGITSEYIEIVQKTSREIFNNFS